MEILKGSMNKFLYKKKSNKINYDDEKPFDSFFRKNRVSFYDDPYTEAVFLLDKGSHPINYKLVNRECVLFKGGEKIQHTKKKQEFERISKIVNNIDFLNSLKNKVHNTDIEKIIEPLGIYAPNEDAQSENEKESKNIYKRKLEALKKKYDGLRGSIDNRIDLELIKAGVFYNKEDVQNILYVVRKYQSEIKKKKNTINAQNDIIGNIVEYNKININKLVVDKRKNEKLMEVCRTYYEQSKNAQKQLKKLKHSFLEYKIALENIVSCCEKIGGDKIILMDGIKAARAQTDLSIATEILNTKKIQELEMNICYCEQHINCLKDDLVLKLEELQKEKKEKKEAKSEILSYKNEISKNNNFLIEVLEDFRRMITSVDDFLNKNEDKNNFSTAFSKNKEKQYNALVKKASDKNKEFKKRGDKLMLSKDVTERELKKHHEYLNKQLSEIKQREAEKEEEEEEKQRKQEEEEKRREKEIEEIKAKNDAEKKAKEEAEKAVEENVENESMESKKIREILGFIKEKNADRLQFEDCIDIIYKANLPLTHSKLSELKSKGDMRKDDFVEFIKTFILDEEEALQNMITFFEIWDVKKTGYMHKDLFVFILKQFGDKLTEDETAYLQKELNLSKESNISYVNLLKKWIKGEEE
ncbi:myosin light chain B, putative [Plasmodium ovale]|uniref:Myosin light chain B, putative n=1 Tax=Plasmodium ovale TaxID=36330 RepID=A0A1D3THY0_PLAOA|nr:myosin light chain B, putative [Plasmodium ovale]